MLALNPLEDMQDATPQQDEGGGGSPTFANPQAAQRFFSDPQAMYQVAQLAAQHHQPQMMQWLERGHMAARENAFEAAQHLMAGDGDAAIKAWNQSGRHTDAKSAAKNADGTWTITRANGQTQNINPEAELRSLMSPKDYFAGQVAERTARAHERTNEIHAEQVKQQGVYQQGLLENQKRESERKGEFDQLRAEMATSRFQAMRDIAAAHDAAKRSVAEAQAGMKEALSKYGPQGIYQNAIKMVADGGAKPEDQPRLAAEILLRSTASVQKSGDTWALVGMTPDGHPSAIASFPNEAAARKQYLDFIKGGPVPTTAEAPKAEEKQPWSAGLTGMFKGGPKDTSARGRLDALSDEQLSNIANDRNPHTDPAAIKAAQDLLAERQRQREDSAARGLPTVY